MAKRTTPSSPTRAILSHEETHKAIRRFEKLLERFEAFDITAIDGIDDPGITEISASARSALERTYQPGTIQYNQYSTVASLESFLPYNVWEPPSVYDVREDLRRGIAECAVLVRQAISDLKEDLDGQDDMSSRASDQPAIALRRAAFIVHGHEEGPREAVARFLQKIDIDPIILHEQPNKGRTVIEKFEEHGNVAFAVVLLTPDDVGGANAGDLNPRARQNVILELGYFIGRLGRPRVCALKKGELEQPSDILGVVYIEYDDGGAWRHKLAQEIQAADFDIDWNKVMKT